MAYLLDGAVILIFVLAILIGYKRGFIKTLSKTATVVLAVILSLSLCGVTAGFVFDSFIAPGVEKSITEKVDGAVSNTTQAVDDAMKEMPSFIQNALAKQGVTDGASMGQKLSLEGSGETVARNVTASVIRPVAVPLLQVFCLLGLFIVFFIAGLIVFRILNLAAKLPGLKQLNKALGSIAGVISGALWVLVAVSLLQGIAFSSAPDALINTGVIADTHIVSFIAGLNPAGVALSQMMQI